MHAENMMADSQDVPVARASFRLDGADLVAARRAYLRWMYTRRAYGLVMAITGGFIAVFYAATMRTPATMGALAGAFLAGAALAIALACVRYALAPLLARRTKEAQSLRQEWQVELSARGLRATTPTQTMFAEWSEYVGWSEDRRVILVYKDKRTYQIIPRRAVTQEWLARFIELVAALPRR